MPRPDDMPPRGPRAGRNLSPARRGAQWNLLLALAVLVPFLALYGGFCELASLAHDWARPDEGHAAPSLGVVLTLVAPLIAALPLALFIGNALVWLHPATRRLMQAAPGLSEAAYQRSQQVLTRLMGVLLPLALVGTTVGVALPWR